MRTNSISTSCSSSSAFGIPSNTELRYASARSWSIVDRAANALRLQVASASASRKAAMRSGASGIMLGECW